MGSVLKFDNSFVSSERSFKINLKVKKGDIFYSNLSPVVGSEQGGLRPVLIVQNDVGNKFSPTVIAAAITTQPKNKLPTHIPIKASKVEAGLSKDSTILLEQIRTIDKSRLIEKVGRIDDESLQEVNKALIVSLGLGCIT
ncbi:MAG: type II toxin-antitoxin system PemK/MazF family toxin [Oscillospiraceae bacterium]|jgi:mRNA interferase MazF|nr:type II toxin-antitoxin system PemK/MazF family toxin [Oscillospiraceae bacterium]